MRTLLKHTTIAAVAALGLASARPALGDAQVPAASADQRTFEGTVISVDSEERTLAVRGLLVKRTFNAATDCRVSLEDKPEATFPDLQAGQRVEVHYYDTHGVRVARQIEQENRVFKGRVTALDPGRRTVTVKRGLATRGFVIAEGGTVLVGGEASASLAGLKIGDTVKVTHQSAEQPIMAHRIEQEFPTFTGTIRAIDARSRTVTLRNLLAEEKFHLAKGCPIVVNGKLDGSLSDLRIGDRMSVSYEDADGVLVANRIGRERASSEEGGGQTAALDHQAP